MTLEIFLCLALRTVSISFLSILLDSSPFPPLLFSRSLLLPFLPLFPFSVLVFVMVASVFEEAGVVAGAARGELSDFAPSHFEDQLQGLLHVL